MRGLLALLALSVGLVAPLNSAAVPQEPPVHISIGDATVTEGSSGTVNATFDVTLSQISSQTVTVDYATANVTATAPDDYLAASGTLTFQPGRTTRPVAVTVNGDTIDEEDETYFVNLSSPVNATIVDGQGLGTITDDDGFPALSIGDATVTEGNSGTVASPIESAGKPSSSVIVPRPCPSTIVALTGLERLTKYVSSSSSIVSPFTVTATGRVVRPGWKVRVPLAAR